MDAKGTVFDIKRGVSKDGPGLRTCVFLKGCPLRCVWCHNPESQSAEIERVVTTGEVCGRVMSVDEVMSEVRRDAVFYRTSGGGVTFTGGEPMMQADFLYGIASAAHGEGIHVAVDTSGFAPWAAFERMLPVADLFLYDLKSVDSGKHSELTGVDNRLILENLLRLDDVGAKTWIRCPLVHGLNDSDEELIALREFTMRLRNMERLEICPYHPLGIEKYAKFGKPLLYDNPDAADKADVERWKQILYGEI